MILLRRLQLIGSPPMCEYQARLSLIVAFVKSELSCFFVGWHCENAKGNLDEGSSGKLGSDQRCNK